MNLKTLYAAEGMAVLESIAAKCDTSAKYLYQCATTKKMPSPALAFKLCAADDRIVFEELFAAAKPPAKRRRKAT